VNFEYEAAWASEMFWKFREEKNYLSFLGNEPLFFGCPSLSPLAILATPTPANKNKLRR
jgi:hypothetical protein